MRDINVSFDVCTFLLRFHFAFLLNKEEGCRKSRKKRYLCEAFHLVGIAIALRFKISLNVHKSIEKSSRYFVWLSSLFSLARVLKETILCACISRASISDNFFPFLRKRDTQKAIGDKIKREHTRILKYGDNIIVIIPQRNEIN